MALGFVIWFVAFAFFLPFTSQDSSSLIVLAVCILALSLMLMANITDARPRPVHLMFCIYMIFFYLLPGYLHTAYGRFPFFAAGYSPPQIFQATIVIAVFLLCVMVGYSVAFPSRGAPRIVIPANLSTAVLICAGVAAVAGAMYGFGALLASRGEESGVLASPSRLIIGTLARSGAFYAFIFSIIAFRHQRDLAGLLTMLATCGLFLFFNSPVAISRSALASYFIIGFFVFFRVGRMQKLALALALVASQGTLFSYISHISRGAVGSEFNLSPLEYYIDSGDFDGLQSTIDVVEMHDQQGAKGGVNLLSAILFFVPRDFWPEKSIGTGGEAAMFLGYPFINISSPLPSEFYVDFGMPGVVILSLLFGLFVRLCDDYFMHFKMTRDLVGQTYVATVAGWLFIFVRGSLIGNLGPILLSLTIAGICHRLTTTPALVHQDDEEAEACDAEDRVTTF